MVAISKLFGYVLFMFNPLVMAYSLPIRYLSRASDVKKRLKFIFVLELSAPGI